MTLYLCTRSDEQYPRGCIYDYLILPRYLSRRMRNSSRQALQSSSSSRENGFFDIWPLFSFFLSFSSFCLSSHLLRHYSHDENEKKSHMNRYRCMAD